jgi:DNA (cytosine-5)-methyltransferase 1
VEYGETSLKVFASYDPSSSSWRTWQPSEAEGLNRVLGDLATLGYDASWTSVRASDVGAAHRRERVFILAYRPDAKDILTAAHARGQRWQWRAARREAPSGWTPSGFIRPGDITLGVAAGRPDATRTRMSSVGDIAWQQYEVAIRRWEAITGRVAPYPVERGTRGQPRLAAAFSEWADGIAFGLRDRTRVAVQRTAPGLG